MDTLFIVLLAFGLQATVFAILMTVWLVRIGTMPVPHRSLPALSAVRPELPVWEPEAVRTGLTVLPGLEGTVMIAGNRSRSAA